MRGQKKQGLTLYKRHNSTCQVHQKRLSPELQKHWMDCDCPIWIEGRTPAGDIVPRQATGETKLKRAEAVKAALVAQSSTVEPGLVDHGPTVHDCIKKYLTSWESKVGDKTLGQHKLILDRLQTFCATRGAVYMTDLTVDLLEDFKTEGLPEAASTSKATWIAKVRCFLKEAYRREWIPESLREKVTTHKVVYEQKKPFEEDEVALILAEALKLNGGTHGYASQSQTFRLLLDLMLETGMRAGDAVRFDPGVLVRGEHLWIYTFYPQKQDKSEVPKLLDVYLTDTLKTAIENCTWLSSKRPFAWGDFRNKTYLANEVYYRMEAIGERCRVADCRPHRLRDTFAVRKLLGGMSIDDLSRLLGHSSVKITEMYYARWSRSRRSRLEGIVTASIMHPAHNTLRNGKSNVLPFRTTGVIDAQDVRLTGE